MALALVADIGGTNTRVALADGGLVRVGTIRRYRNAQYPGLAPVLQTYLAEMRQDAVAGACVAAAGPVHDGVATMTNLDWTIDTPSVAAATGAVRVAILNDLQAQGHALGHIAPGHLRRVIDGPEQPGGPMLVVGLGTGVNAAPVHGHGAHRVVPPSECGHVNLPVRGAEDLRMMQFVERLLASRGEPAHCGVEEVLAGRGLANLHSFAAAEAGDHSEVASAEVLARLAAGDPAAVHAAGLYTRVLAQVLADLALIHLPWGGIYLIGGMARAMTPHFDRFGLVSGFREMRRIDLLTHAFAVSVVEDDYAALTGCAVHLDAC